jgi:hypothetical protein
MGHETFAAAYGIPLETLRARERHQLEPEMTKMRVVGTAS